MRKPRRKFTSDFKQGAVKLVLEQGMTRSKVAEDLGVNANIVSKWVREYQADGSDAFPGNGQLSSQDRKIRDLEEGKSSVAHGARYLKKGHGVLCKPRTVKYAFIRKHQHEFPVGLMCRLLEVSKSGFYAWKMRGGYEISPSQLRLYEEVRKMFEKKKKTIWKSSSMARTKEIRISR